MAKPCHLRHFGRFYIYPSEDLSRTMERLQYFRGRNWLDEVGWGSNDQTTTPGLPQCGSSSKPGSKDYSFVLVGLAFCFLTGHACSRETSMKLTKHLDDRAMGALLASKVRNLYTIRTCFFFFFSQLDFLPSYRRSHTVWGIKWLHLL